MGEHQPAGRAEVGARPLSPGVQGRLSFEEQPEPGKPEAAAEPEPGKPEAAAEPEPGKPEAAAEPEPSPETVATTLVVRVLPDVVTIDKTFDYAVPAAWHADGRAARLAVGSIVRIDLGGRRLRGWVTEIGVEPPPGVKLLPLAKLTGMGPPQELVDLADWAAWRWAGRRVSLLRTASPPRVLARVTPRPVEAKPDAVAGLRPGPTESGAPGGEAPIAGAALDPDAGDDDVFADPGAVTSYSLAAHMQQRGYDDVFGDPGAVTVVRCPPAGDAAAVARAAARWGDALIVVPALSEAARLAAALRRDGVRVALGFDDWARAAAGATVVGTRTAVWMPMPRLAAVVVFDEHDESLQSEHSPAWHARDVALERARRAGVPAALVSPAPSLEALEAGPLRSPDRVAERDGWPVVHVLDRRRDDPVRGGPFAEGLRSRLSPGGRVAVVLNRKGRARLLACKGCGELVRSADGRVPMVLDDAELVAADGRERRPVVCALCGSTALRNLRMGVARAREELAALAGEPVGELTAETGAVPGERIVIGTEAVLWRLESAGAVVFLDFDQELLAPRQRAAEQALALLARAARLVGGRRGGGRLVVQTRQPDDPVIQAAVRADPSIVASVTRDQRRALGLPPYGAQAKVSGPGAEAFIAALREAGDATGADPGGAVSVRGPLDGNFLLRAPRHEPLLDLLARTPRPAERLRVEVDPLRA